MNNTLSDTARKTGTAKGDFQVTDSCRTLFDEFIVGWVVDDVREPTALQAMLDRSPPAERYYSDGYSLYETLIYAPGHHLAVSDKSQTYSVEADNAELRHYLARLARRSRCFSRCIEALRRAIKFFVFAWNRRQLYKRRFPTYPAHLRDFIGP